MTALQKQIAASRAHGGMQTEWGSPDCPYEIAARKVERYTKVPRAIWESSINHPFNRVTLKLARYLAGVKDEGNHFGTKARKTYTRSVKIKD
jgi:hypothetical protein